MSPDHPQIHLGLVIHNHQPIGNFGWVFQDACDHAYEPMITALEQHPAIKVGLHYTGSLLEWLEANRPEFMMRVKSLADRGQVELLSGGFYEPIFPSIPDEDKVTQIQMLSSYISDHFGQAPSGGWLAERVWEPGLPEFLERGNIKWTILDDTHFKMVGMNDSQLTGYFLTEDQGHMVRLFATSKTLRYLIPFHGVGEVIDYLRSQATIEGDRILVMGDDGEKFGIWPGTFEHAWGTGNWIPDLFKALEDCGDWLHTMLLSDYVKKYPARGRVYLPSSSYSEMMEWALPAQQSAELSELTHRMEAENNHYVLQFLRGSHWRAFLAKYPEINHQHKRMMLAREMVRQAGNTNEVGLQNVLRAQANDTYWHGLFGGTYTPHMRAAIYQHLLRAESAASIKLHEKQTKWLDIEEKDFNYDGYPEVLIRTASQNIIIAPSQGASILEWDLCGSETNIINTMARRPESYHQTIRSIDPGSYTSHDGNSESPGSPHTTVRVKEDGLAGYLHYDRYLRSAALEHLVPEWTGADDFLSAQYQEIAAFPNLKYTQNLQKVSAEIIQIEYRTHFENKLLFEKHFLIRQSSTDVDISYRMTNTGEDDIQARFISEWSFNLLGGGHNPQAYFTSDGDSSTLVPFDDTSTHQGLRSFSIGNHYTGVELSLTSERPFDLWRGSIDTVTGSESGFERTHQGSTFAISWPVTIKKGDSWSGTLTWKSSSFKK